MYRFLFAFVRPSLLALVLWGIIATEEIEAVPMPVTSITGANSNIQCPVPTTSEEFGSHKVLNLSEIKGKRVRLQFFYPREEASKRLLDSKELALLAQDAAENKTQTTTEPDSGAAGPSEEITSTERSSNSERADLDLFNQDIFCQWTFQAGNDTEFLSLTFEKLSAPYSDDCTKAFVALQKENGYESRWCGNRRNANARPMSLLAKSKAVITVFRSGTAPLLPPTGFTVTVKVLDAGSFQGADTPLRILRG